MKILTEHIELEFPGGTDIDDAITKAKLEANRFNFPVKFEFNSVEIIILLNPPPIDYTLIISPKLEELIKLDMEWRKLDEVLYKQRWLKYDLSRKKSSRKRLPLPN